MGHPQRTTSESTRRREAGTPQAAGKAEDGPGAPQAKGRRAGERNKDMGRASPNRQGAAGGTQARRKEKENEPEPSTQEAQGPHRKVGRIGVGEQMEEGRPRPDGDHLDQPLERQAGLAIPSTAHTSLPEASIFLVGYGPNFSEHTSLRTRETRA